jgi:hypothetical protein
MKVLLVILFCAAAPAQVTLGRFDPATGCEKTPALIKDAAKDAGIDAKRLCYVRDRERFAAKAGEAFARDLDRKGKLVRVVIPFGHLLLINGTEPAVQLAVRAYDSENELRTSVARLGEERYFGHANEFTTYAWQALVALKKAYAAELAPYRDAAQD